MPGASADQVGSLQAQAHALEAKITALGQREDALSQQYDLATSQLQSAKQKVASAATKVAEANAASAKAREALKQQAIQDYIQGGNSDLTLNPGSLRNATTEMLAQQYESSLAATEHDAVDQYHLAALQDHAAKQSFQARQRAEQEKVNQLARDKEAGMAAEAQLESALKQDKGQIATLIAQRQAAQQPVSVVATSSRHVAAPVQNTPGPAPAAGPVAAAAAPATAPVAAPVGRGAAGAVAAALSRVGAPYVFGGAGPWAFDCSGLVMWAYEQVGIYLPHPSGAQYAAITHIPMSDLEPGDIVFDADPSVHEAMYIGGGMIVEAQHTGTNVLVTPLRSEFVLAGRPA